MLTEEPEPPDDDADMHRGHGNLLAVVTIIGIIVIGLVISIDLLSDGMIEPALLALFVVILSPLVPALIANVNKP